jgi:hypothetical protein
MANVKEQGDADAERCDNGMTIARSAPGEIITKKKIAINAQSSIAYLVIASLASVALCRSGSQDRAKISGRDLSHIRPKNAECARGYRRSSAWLSKGYGALYCSISEGCGDSALYCSISEQPGRISMARVARAVAILDPLRRGGHALDRDRPLFTRGPTPTD